MKTHFLLALLLAIPLLFALSLSGPLINSGVPAFTDENLVCEWSVSGDTTSQNVTMYRDGTPVLTREETGPGLNESYTVLQGNTTKNEEWICSVRIANGTATQEENTTITIQNSAPETPVVFDESDQNIGTEYTVFEDQTYLFDVNASDVDNDELTYYFKTATQGFCTMTDSDAGIASCTPEEEDHTGTNTTNNITFWVDDDDTIFAKSSSLKVTFNVIPVNDAPESNLENQETPVNATFNYDFNATDEENSTPLSFSFFEVPSEIANKLSIVSVDDTLGRITYDGSTTDFNDVNETGWNITVNTTDATGKSGLDSFLLNITAVGRAPEIQNVEPQGPYNLLQGENIKINITATDLDANETHTFSDSSGIPNFVTITTQPFNNITGSTTGQISFNASNSEVGNYSVNITVTDQEFLTDTIQIDFIINNTNDPPIISELSNFESNTQENTNSSDILAFVNSPFSFTINASDPDEAFGDTLNFTDNTSLFDIDQDGVISFVPNSSQSGTHSINITATDNQSESTSRTIELTIDPNVAPRFTEDPLPAANCSEGQYCIYNLSNFTTDDDPGDFIVEYGSETNISSFTLNSTSGLINFTPEQTDVGNYTIDITIKDTRGAIAESQLELTINNTPDSPELIRFNLSEQTIVETFPFTFELQAEDNDLLVGDTHNYSINISYIDLSSVSINNNRSSAVLSFTPNQSQVGTETINITVEDSTGRSQTKIVTFEIKEKTNPPEILAVQPWGNASAGNAAIESFNTTSQGTQTTIDITENSSYLFAHLSEDDITPNNELITTWFYDGEKVAETWNYTRSFDFFSSGEHTVELEVNDSTLGSTTFTWNLDISDVNRPPVLINDLREPLEVNSTESFSNYFTTYLDTQRFYDPDDDLNQDGTLNSDETNSLTFVSTECTSDSRTVATISSAGDDLVIIPESIGSCSVVFTAIDEAGDDAVSNSVTIEVTNVPDSEEEETTTTSTGGGGGSSSRSSFVPITTEEESPEPLNIIAPKLVEIYENNSVTIPFEIENTWDEDLEFVELSVNTNETGIETSLSSNLIETLRVNETREVQLVVSNYRLGENYEIEILAQVDDPEFEDSALVLLNSIEQASDGDDTELKVTFAQDLLNEHPECQELNELLDQAQQELSRGNMAEANRYVDGAINGCRYIVSTLSQNTERPDSLSSMITLDEITLQILLYASLAFVILITMAFIIYYHYTNREEDDI